MRLLVLADTHGDVDAVSEPMAGLLHLHDLGGKIAFASLLDASGHLVYSTEPSGHDELFDDGQRLLEVFGLKLDAAYMRREQFNRMMKECHVALQ